MIRKIRIILRITPRPPDPERSGSFFGVVFPCWGWAGGNGGG